MDIQDLTLKKTLQTIRFSSSFTKKNNAIISIILLILQVIT